MVRSMYLSPLRSPVTGSRSSGWLIAAQPILAGLKRSEVGRGPDPEILLSGSSGDDHIASAQLGKRSVRVGVGPQRAARPLVENDVGIAVGGHIMLRTLGGIAFLERAFGPFFRLVLIGRRSVGGSAGGGVRPGRNRFRRIAARGRGLAARSARFGRAVRPGLLLGGLGWCRHRTGAGRRQRPAPAQSRARGLVIADLNRVERPGMGEDWGVGRNMSKGPPASASPLPSSAPPREPNYAVQDEEPKWRRCRQETGRSASASGDTLPSSHIGVVPCDDAGITKGKKDFGRRQQTNPKTTPQALIRRGFPPRPIAAPISNKDPTVRLLGRGSERTGCEGGPPI